MSATLYPRKVKQKEAADVVPDGPQTCLAPLAGTRPATFVYSGPQSSWWPSTETQTGPEQKPDQEQQTDLKRQEGDRRSVTLQGLMGKNRQNWVKVYRPVLQLWL